MCDEYEIPYWRCGACYGDLAYSMPNHKEKIVYGMLNVFIDINLQEVIGVNSTL